MATETIEPRTELGRQLEKERVNRGLTKEAWCRELDNLGRPTYNNWLTRSVDLQFPNVRLIADKLDVSLGEVYEWLASDRAKGVWLRSEMAFAA